MQLVLKHVFSSDAAISLARRQSLAGRRKDIGRRATIQPYYVPGSGRVHDPLVRAAKKGRKIQART
jgi:hypothetical protein